MKRVLVTGSSGFIGSAVCRELADAGYSVAGVDLQNPGETVPGVTVAQCDILDADALDRAFEKLAPDWIVHLAARADLNGATVADYAANIRGVQNVIAAATKAGTVERAIFTSTQLVCHVGYAPRGPEDYNPTTAYGESKVLGEKVVRESDCGRISWCITRPTTVWGPGMNAHYRRFLRMLRRGRYFHVGRSPLHKHYGFVGNIAFQYRKLLEASEGDVHRQTFYVADYQPIVLQEWVNQLQRALGGPSVRTLPLPLARSLARIGDGFNALGVSCPFDSFRLRNILAEYQFDLTNTRKICGSLPWSVADGVTATAEWFLQSDR